MKKILLLICITIAFFGCEKKEATQFSEKALEEKMISLDNEIITFKEILNKYST